MEKINFEDGQLLEKAYTIINGKKHYVEKATYTGSTPLSAFVLNKMQQNIETAIEEKTSLPTGGTTGQVLAKASDNDGDVEWVEQSGSGTTTGDTLPIGSVLEWYADTVPANWLLCDGQAVSRTDYTELFSLFGTKYGVGDGSTTFNLPDMRGKGPIGEDENDEDFNEIGKTGGEKKHTLTIAEMAKHNHNFIDNNSNVMPTIAAMKNGGSNDLTQIGGAKSYDYFYVNYTGNNQPFNIMQPHIVCKFIIKAKQSSGLVATVVDNLGSTSETDALSAKQGKILNDKVEKINTHSTEEVVIGKWIDGKTMYSKTFSKTGSGNIDISDLNIENAFFDFSNSYLTWTNQGRITPITLVGISQGNVDGRYQAGVYFNANFSSVIIEAGTQVTLGKCYITIRYTKKNEG